MSTGNSNSISNPSMPASPRNPLGRDAVTVAPEAALWRPVDRKPAWTGDGPGRPPALDRQAGWLKVGVSRAKARMWSLIEKATTAPRVVAGRPRLDTSSANTDNR